VQRYNLFRYPPNIWAIILGKITKVFRFLDTGQPQTREMTEKTEKEALLRCGKSNNDGFVHARIIIMYMAENEGMQSLRHENAAFARNKRGIFYAHAIEAF
jgi:CDGSH-type Zn-finger protein